MSRESVTHEVIRTAGISGRERYELLISLVVPRPIGWLSTRSAAGHRNLAPFSYFAALAASPMLVGASIGHRRDGPKDTLRHIRETGAFCANIVTERHLEAMNRTSADVPGGVDEFDLAGLAAGEAETVPAPFVADCPAVLECRLFRDVELGGAPNTLVIGHVTAIRLDPTLARVAGTSFVDPVSLRPVGRLWGAAYGLLGEVRVLPRPGSEPPRA